MALLRQFVGPDAAGRYISESIRRAFIQIDVMLPPHFSIGPTASQDRNRVTRGFFKHGQSYGNKRDATYLTSTSLVQKQVKAGAGPAFYGLF